MIKAIATPSRYLVVGMACAILNIALIVGLDRCGLHYALAFSIAFVVVLLAGYLLHVGFTFSAHASFSSFWRYALGMALNYPANIALLFLTCDILGWPITVAAPVATVVMTVWNFGASRWAIART